MLVIFTFPYLSLVMLSGDENCSFQQTGKTNKPLLQLIIGGNIRRKVATEAQHRHQVVKLENTHVGTDMHRIKHTHTCTHLPPLPIMLFQIGEISWHLSHWVRLCLLMTRLAAITGIHGVSSSEWFPISQSVPGNKKLLLGVIAFSWNSKDPKSTRAP